MAVPPLDTKDMCVTDPRVLLDTLLTEADEVGVSTAPVVADSPRSGAMAMDNALCRLAAVPSVDSLEVAVNDSSMVELTAAVSVLLGL